MTSHNVLPGCKDHQYLGDGVYAAHDDYQIWLEVTRDGEPSRIALDIYTIDALLKYAAKIGMTTKTKHTPPG